MEESRYIITIKGKATHAMEPDKGINAAVYLAKILQQELTTEASKQFVDFIADVFIRIIMVVSSICSLRIQCQDKQH